MLERYHHEQAGQLVTGIHLQGHFVGIYFGVGDTDCGHFYSVYATDHGALTRQMEENLQLLAQSKAEEINLKLDEVMHSTLIAAQLTAEALQMPANPANLSQSFSPLPARFTANCGVGK